MLVPLPAAEHGPSITESHWVKISVGRGLVVNQPATGAGWRVAEEMISTDSHARAFLSGIHATVGGMR
jgi:hypothetical protein